MAQSRSITKADVIGKGVIAAVVRDLADVLVDAGERCIRRLPSRAPSRLDTKGPQ